MTASVTDNHKWILLAATLFLVLIIPNVYAMKYVENDDGSYYYELDIENDPEIRSNIINLGSLLTMIPSPEPESPSVGTIYLNADINRLMMFNGSEWRYIDLSEEDDKKPKIKKTDGCQPLLTIGKDTCSSVGTYDQKTDTCMLNEDLGPFCANGVALQSTGTADDQIILDCNDHSITGSSSYTGITGNRNWKVVNCEISDFNIGILAKSLDTSTGTEITGNTITRNVYGIWIDGSYYGSGITIADNIIESTTADIYLKNGASGNTITGNTMTIGVIDVENAVGTDNVIAEQPQEVVEEVEEPAIEEPEVACEYDKSCSEWGECINSYQLRTCAVTTTSCESVQEEETQSCAIEEVLEEVPTEEITDEPVEDVPEIAEAEAPVEEGAEEEAAEVPEEDIEEEPAEEIADEETEAAEEVVEEVAVEEVVEEAAAETIEEPTPIEATPEVAEEVEIPEELMDITFVLEDRTIENTGQLITWTTLEKFGKKAVKARLIFVILTEDGTEVYRGSEERTVYTEEAVVKRFDDLGLPDGIYQLNMKIEYASIMEEFKDEFIIDTTPSSNIVDLLIGLFKNIFILM